MADSYTGAFTYIEEKAKDVLAADANLLTGSGTRIEVKTFEDEPRARTSLYMDHQLPAIATFCTASSREEPEAIGGQMVARFDLVVFVICAGTYGETKMTLVKDIAARVITVLAQQYGTNQMDGLDALVPDADPGSVDTYFVSADFDEAGGQGGEDGGDAPYRTLAEIHFDVEISLTR